jgi:Spy/CpxP family protein refolding chaperone
MSDLFNEPVEEIPAPKKKKGKKVLISSVIVFFLIVAVAGISFAKKMGQMHDGPLGFMIEKMTKDLDLNADQKTQVDKIKDEIKTRMEANKQDHKQTAGDFANLFKQSTLDKQQLLDLEAKREKNREDMKSFMMDELIKFHDLLTQTQRDKVADKIKEFGQHKDHDGKDGKDKRKSDNQ